MASRVSTYLGQLFRPLFERMQNSPIGIISAIGGNAVLAIDGKDPSNGQQTGPGSPEQGSPTLQELQTGLDVVARQSNIQSQVSANLDPQTRSNLNAVVSGAQEERLATQVAGNNYSPYTRQLNSEGVQERISRLGEIQRQMSRRETKEETKERLRKMEEAAKAYDTSEALKSKPLPKIPRPASMQPKATPKAPEPLKRAASAPPSLNRSPSKPLPPTPTTKNNNEKRPQSTPTPSNSSTEPSAKRAASAPPKSGVKDMDQELGDFLGELGITLPEVKKGNTNVMNEEAPTVSAKAVQAKIAKLIDKLETKENLSNQQNEAKTMMENHLKEVSQSNPSPDRLNDLVKLYGPIRSNEEINTTEFLDQARQYEEAEFDRNFGDENLYEDLDEIENDMKSRLESDDTEVLEDLDDLISRNSNREIPRSSAQGKPSANSDQTRLRDTGSRERRTVSPEERFARMKANAGQPVGNQENLRSRFQALKSRVENMNQAPQESRGKPSSANDLRRAVLKNNFSASQEKRASQLNENTSPNPPIVESGPSSGRK